MKQLEKQFIGKGEIRGFEFTQLLETNAAYLYKVNCDGRIHYEVFTKRQNKRFNIYSFPSSKSFGIWAWTAYTLERALQRLQTLLDKGEKMPVLA